MIYVLWEFTVNPGSGREFEDRYRAKGDWTRLFSSADGFVRNLLLRDMARQGRYVTIDVWHTRTEFERFRDANTTRQPEINAACAPLANEERVIGTFDVFE